MAVANRSGASAARPAPAPRALRILLAEDNTVNQKLATRILEKQGHHVVVVGDGESAVATLARETFDLVLMDVQMPMMDGFEATAAIRAGESATGERIPIIAMTAHAMQGDRERCLGAGMDAYIAKPVRRGDLMETIAGVMAERSAGRVEGEPETPVRYSPQSLS